MLELTRGEARICARGEARGDSGDLSLLTPDLINMREGKHTGEGGTTWRVKLIVIKDME
jgi:hypothetical protein